MSKRPLAPAAKASAVRQYLNFEDWKVQQANTGPNEHTDGYVYDPSTENLPDKLWYKLDIDSIRTTIQQMCERLGLPVTNRKMTDSEIADFIKALDRAKKLPRPKKINMAVVGNQGVGKSSTLNALMNHNLVEASASSSACTAFATIIEYKDDAPDDSRVSDLRVTFYGIQQIHDFIEEHIKRYADVHKPIEHEEDGMREEEEEEDEISEAEASDEDSVSGAAPKCFQGAAKRKKVPKALQKAADTAEQFFRILFRADSISR